MTNQVKKRKRHCSLSGTSESTSQIVLQRNGEKNHGLILAELDGNENV
ncbi:Uncharacterized protein APZ42_021187 [Daphnia magna]|uniref:Uncharacterized protein n=1 Tax=Daphnia magna TaxID=35525 RepID=A0A164X239_9CRUS|nr:Uncharacterized protein APZ42_021187 [Daphnia magna]